MNRSQPGRRKVRSFVDSSLHSRSRYNLTGRYPFTRIGASVFKEHRSSRKHSSRRSTDTRSRYRQSWPSRVAYHIVWMAISAGARLMFRLRVEGEENFPPGPFVLAPVHRSVIDTPIAALLTRRRLRFMGKETLWESKALGMFLSVLGGFPVERGTADRSALRAAADVLALGEPLVMFPEGTRQDGPRVRRSDMLDGPAFVASRAGVPIVPVGLGGTVRALPVGSKIPRPVKVAAVVGNPISPPPKLGGRVPRRSVRQLTDQLFTELDDLYSEARSIAGDGSMQGRLPWWRRVVWLTPGGSRQRRAVSLSVSARSVSDGLLSRMRVTQSVSNRLKRWRQQLGCVQWRQQLPSCFTLSRFLPGGLERWRLAMSRLAPARLVSGILPSGWQQRRRCSVSSSNTSDSSSNTSDDYSGTE